MSFPQFALLPPEIQIKIWAFHLPPPRIVDLFAVPVSESLQLHFDDDATTSPPCPPSASRSSTSPVPPSTTPVPDTTPQASPTTKWTPTFIERIYTTPHKLQHLHICAEARKTALKRYVRINADMDLKGEMRFECLLPSPDERNGNGRAAEAVYCVATLKGARPYALFDPERDILFLQDPPRTLDRTGGLVTSSIDILLRWSLVPACRVERLAVPYYTWRKTRDLGKLGLVRRFGMLEELYVSFLGDGFEGSYRATWSDAVGGLWSHVEEVEKEVRDDVENLKREDPEWRVPRVRVVRHRGVLGEELVG